MRSLKRIQILFLILSIILLYGFSASNYIQKAEPLPNMPEGNPDLSLGIVVRSNSTGIDVVGDSSQNIRFRAFKNFEETHLEQLRSPSIVDKTPKKFKFLDEKYGISSDNIYEFSITFDSTNHEWKYISFMPFNSVIEWVTEEKLREYLDAWVKKFEDAGWVRVEYPKSDDPWKIQNFSIPTPENNHPSQYCSWKTREFEASINVRLRDNFNYRSYIPKNDRKKVTQIPNGYIAFIDINRRKS